MATLYDYLPPATRQQFPLQRLDADAQKFLNTDVPPDYPQDRLAKLVGMVQSGIGRRATPAMMAAHPSTVGQRPSQAELASIPENQAASRYANAGDLYKAGAQFAEASGRELSLPKIPGVPAPSTLPERAGAMAGSVTGFVGKTGVLAGLGVPPWAAMGGAAAASRGTLKERAVRGAVTAAVAGPLEAASGALTGAAAKTGSALAAGSAKAATMAGSSVAFGAAQPAAESAVMHLTGDKDYPAPTIDDMLKGTAEQALITGLFEVPGAIRSATAPRSGAKVLPGGKSIGRGAPGRPMEEVQPAGLLPETATIPRSRRLPPGPAPEGQTREMPAGAGAPPAVFPVGLQLPPSTAPSRTFEMGPKVEPVTPTEEKLAPYRPVIKATGGKLATDSRTTARGSISDQFHQDVAAELDRAGATNPNAADVRQAAVAASKRGMARSTADVLDAIEPPYMAAPALRAREQRFSEELGKRTIGRTVEMSVQGQLVPMRIAQIVAFRYPQVRDPVRVVFEDVSNGKLIPARFQSVSEFAQSIGNPKAVAWSEDIFTRQERQRGMKRPAAPKTAPVEQATGGTGLDALAAPPAVTAPPAPAPESRPAEPPKPAAPAAPSRPRSVVDLPVRDAKSAQRLVDGLNRQNPDLEARIEMRGSKAVVTANSDAKEPPKPTPKPAPVAAVPKRTEPPSEPPPSPAKVEPEPPAKPSPAAPEPAITRFKAGERVTVPNHNGRGNDLRVAGHVRGYTSDDTGARKVVVEVRRGKSLHTELHDEAGIRRRPKVTSSGLVITRSLEERFAPFIRALEKRTGGSLTKMHESIAELKKMSNEAGATLDEQKYQPDVAEPKERRSRKLFLQAEAVDSHITAKLREAFGPTATYRARENLAFAEPYLAAVKTHPAIKTYENDETYLRHVESRVIGSPEEAAHLLDYAGRKTGGSVEAAMPVLRGARYLASTEALLKDLPADAPDFMREDAELGKQIKTIMDGLEPERAAKVIDELLGPSGPADDIPGGTVPVPPDDFVEFIKGEQGKVPLEMFAPWLWWKALRRIPAQRAKAIRNIPKGQRVFNTYDANGNLISRQPHNLYDYDEYSSSAFSRFLAGWGIGSGNSVFTKGQALDYKASRSDQVKLDSYMRFMWTHHLGDAAKFIRPESRLARKVGAVAEGRGKLTDLPPHARPAVQAVKDYYAWALKLINKYRVAAGEEPLVSRFEGKYAMPHKVHGMISQNQETLFARFLGLRGPTPETTEMRNRFLNERTGDVNYSDDVALAADTYIRAMSKYLSHLGFFKRLGEDIAVMETSDRNRAAAIVNLLKATMMRKKGSYEQLLDTSLSAIRFAKSSPEIIETSLEGAATAAGLDVAALKKAGMERAFVVPKGAKFRVGTDAKAYRRSGMETAAGDPIYLTKGAHLFSEKARPRALETGLAKLGIKAGVKIDRALEAVNKRVTGKEGEFISPHFTNDEHMRMRFRAWRRDVLAEQSRMVDSAFRAMGDRMTRALLGGNLRSALNNASQAVITSIPEFGFRDTIAGLYKNTVRPVKHWLIDRDVKAGRLTPKQAEQMKLNAPVGRRIAAMVGSLQGEVHSEGGLAEQRGWLSKLLQHAHGLGPFQMAEDYSRGSAALGAVLAAKRLGYKPPIPARPHKEVNMRYFAEWDRRIRAMRQEGTTEGFIARTDSKVSFDYNLLGQSPIFGGPVGKLFGRLMTFPGNYFRRYVTGPIGGSAKVARALIAGGIDRATRGGLQKLGMHVGPGERFPRNVRGGVKYKAGGQYPGPTNAFEAFLEYYGARYQQRHEAGMLMKQVGTILAMGAATAATGLNAFLPGTPGWDQLVLTQLQARTKKGSRAHDVFTKALQYSDRSAVIDPGSSIEGRMGPFPRLIFQTINGEAQAMKTARSKAAKGDAVGATNALIEPIVSGMHEFGLEFSGLPIVAIRRALQNMPDAEQFFTTPTGKFVAHLLNIKSYVKGNGVQQFIEANVGLRSPVEEAKQREKVNKPAARGRGGRRRIISDLIQPRSQGGPDAAFA